MVEGQYTPTADAEKSPKGVKSTDDEGSIGREKEKKKWYAFRGVK